MDDSYVGPYVAILRVSCGGHYVAFMRGRYGLPMYALQEKYMVAPM
jgi:hypothetical protein